MKKLHLVCNSHLDPVWQWDFEEGMTAALATFCSAVELADEYDYIFCHNEALLYEWVEENDPEPVAKETDFYMNGYTVALSFGKFEVKTMILDENGLREHPGMIVLP